MLRANAPRNGDERAHEYLNKRLGKVRTRRVGTNKIDNLEPDTERRDHEIVKANKKNIIIIREIWGKKKKDWESDGRFSSRLQVWKKKPADWLLILVRSRGNWQNERAKQSDSVVVKGWGGGGEGG